jgi:hypothetical protein
MLSAVAKPLVLITKNPSATDMNPAFMLIFLKRLLLILYLPGNPARSSCRFPLDVCQFGFVPFFFRMSWFSGSGTPSAETGC